MTGRWEPAPLRLAQRAVHSGFVLAVSHSQTEGNSWPAAEISVLTTEAADGAAARGLGHTIDVASLCQNLRRISATLEAVLTNDKGYFSLLHPAQKIDATFWHNDATLCACPGGGEGLLDAGSGRWNRNLGGGARPRAAVVGHAAAAARQPPP